LNKEDKTVAEPRSAEMIAGLMLVGALALSFSIFFYVSWAEKKSTVVRLDATSSQVALRIEEFFEDRIRALIKTASWAANTDLRMDTFREKTEELQGTFPGFLATAWLKPDRTIVWNFPHPENAMTEGKNLSRHPLAGAVLKQAKETERPIATPPLDLIQGGRGFVVFVAAIANDDLHGFVGGPFRFDILKQRLLAGELSGSFSISVTDDDKTVLSVGGTGAAPSIETTRQITVADRLWTLKLGVHQLNSTRWLEMVASLLLPILLSIVTLVAVRRDNAVKFEMRRNQSQLELAIVARTEELRSAVADAEAANDAKSQFLASMSHELRTPLNAVLGFAQLMQHNLKDPLSPIQNEYIGNILEGGEHLLQLIDEVLDLARIEADQLELNLEEIDAGATIAECIALMETFAQSRQVELVDRISDKAPTLVRTDKLRVKQVLLNLLSNAIKYNKAGGTVTVDGREMADGFVCVSVADTGVGIPSEDRSNVFQMFHQVGMDPMKAREGTGIGLAVTKLLVERMAGRIGFESEEGVGSTFWVEMPLASNDSVLIWANALSIGVDAIDKDHQVIISLLNRVTQESADDADLNEVVQELIDYTQYHFKREEAVMEACGYPDLEKHRGLHQSLVVQISAFEQARSKDSGPEQFSHLSTFLRDWLFDHIIKIDGEISQYTKGKEQEIRKALQDFE
jgi:hemerythrin-like metal-binding protein